MTLVLRKLLASSTFRDRRRAYVDLEPAQGQATEAGAERIAWKKNSTRTTRRWTKPRRNGHEEEPAAPLSEADRAAIEAEIADLDDFARLATSIEHNAKGKALLKALAIALKKADGTRRRSRRRSSSPNPAARRAICYAYWRTARGRTASSYSTAPTPTIVPRRSTPPGWSVTRAPTASPDRGPPTCVPPWSITSASKDRS